MKQTKQNYFQKNNFKSTLWNEVSSSCEGGLWCHSKIERSVFYGLFSLTLVLGILYFSGFTNELASIFKSTRELDQLNDLKIKSMEAEIITVSPTIAQTNSQ